MTEIILGIDPGKNGAAVELYSPFQPTISSFAGLTEGDIADWFKALREARRHVSVFAYLEEIVPVVGWDIGSLGKILGSYYFLRGVLKTCDIRFEIVRPAKWQRALGCLSHGDKNVTKAKAQELFPSIKVTHAIADALLIAEYGRRQRLGLHHKAQEPRTPNGKA